MDYTFVLGCGHSGTSLLAAMLGAHTQIYAIPFETNAFRGTAADGKVKIQEIALQCVKPGVSYICEKTPAHVLQISRILEAFAEGKLLFIVRDPRDVVASFRRRGMEFGYGIQRWRKANSAIRKASLLPNAYIIKYEDLIADSESALRKLCAFLALPYDPAMLNYWKDNREWFGVRERSKPKSVEGKNHTAYRNWQIHQPIMKNTVSSYKKTLSEAEIAAVEYQLANLAGYFGYKMLSGSALLGPGEPI